MSFSQWKETIELLANIVTIFGFLIGITYVYKIYNRIDISIQGENITIDKINIALPEKDYFDISYGSEKLKDIEKIYPSKKVGEI